MTASATTMMEVEGGIFVEIMHPYVWSLSDITFYGRIGRTTPSSELTENKFVCSVKVWELRLHRSAHKQTGTSDLGLLLSSVRLLKVTTPAGQWNLAIEFVNIHHVRVDVFLFKLCVC